MVLATHHHTQSSYAVFPLRSFSWSKGIKLKHNGVKCQTNARIDRCTKLKHSFPVRPVPCGVCAVKGKPLQITSFKGNIQNNKGGDSSSKSILPKSSVKISILPQDRDESLAESLTTADEMSVSCTSESNKIISGSQAVRGLFMKWLNRLHTGTPSETGSNILEKPPQTDHPQEQKVANTKRGEILKVVLSYFLGLDATITIPLLIFIPLYLAVNVVYGPEVSRELTPLWVIGPLIVALYVKLLRGIVALYVFSFKQSVKLIKNLPLFYSIAYKYIIKGKLKEEIHARLWQPVANLRELDYKELSMRNWKVFREWLMEKYLDYVESIWPYYCRTIRFLKRANLL